MGRGENSGDAKLYTFAEKINMLTQMLQKIENEQNRTFEAIDSIVNVNKHIISNQEHASNQLESVQESSRMSQFAA